MKQKAFTLDDLHGYVQWNPCRKGSTVAKVDSDSIANRRCFLCKENRPPNQKAKELVEGWELLENPFPVFNPHFTIVKKSHNPQIFELGIATQWVKHLPGMTVFYNDPGAGASAPDHAHYQAVKTSELPLINFLDSRWPEDDISSLSPLSNSLNLPFKIITGTVTPDLVFNYESPFNAYIWESVTGSIRYLVIPRKAHRPALYFKELPHRRAFSPGAIDMAGVLITPFGEDFNAVSNEEIRLIYRDVAYSNE